jgi:hypothetical protein
LLLAGALCQGIFLGITGDLYRVITGYGIGLKELEVSTFKAAGGHLVLFLKPFYFFLFFCILG